MRTPLEIFTVFRYWGLVLTSQEFFVFWTRRKHDYGDLCTTPKMASRLLSHPLVAHARISRAPFQSLSFSPASPNRTRLRHQLHRCQAEENEEIVETPPPPKPVDPPTPPDTRATESTDQGPVSLVANLITWGFILVHPSTSIPLSSTSSLCTVSLCRFHFLYSFASVPSRYATT